MNRRFLASFVFLCGTLSSFSQSKNANTLLWRISGNGLSQSSYLFGTMHLTDKRLFNFDDSLYHALEVTDGTAIEVNPDEMMAYSFNQELENMQKGKYLKDILSEKDYEKYSAALAKKLNKPANEITEKDLLLEKNSWTTEYLAKGEMPTFVDAYLFYTAKKQAKWVGGIEDITDQAGLLENIDKADIEFMLNKSAKNIADNMMEQMIAQYVNQDIDELCRFTSGEDSAKHEAIITRRNIKMAYRIDSMAHTRAMLFAIGAAHLANDEGVINLLRKRGFTVTPVIGSKKISSKEYKYDEKPTPWYTVNDKQGLYTAMMPGNPFAKGVSGVVDAQFYFDLSSYSGYGIMSIVTPGKIQNRDSVFQAFAANMFKGDKKLKPTPVVKDSLTGVEYMSSMRGMSSRVQLFTKGNVIYVPMFYALKKDSLSGANAKKFFDSFVMKDAPFAYGMLYNDSLAGVVTTLPMELEYSGQLSHLVVKGWKVVAYAGGDAGSGSYVVKFDKRPIKGRNIVSDSLIFEETRLGMREKFKETKNERLKIGGYNAAYFEGEINGFKGRILNIVRGNHNVAIMAVGDSVAIFQPVYNDMFGNIKFVPYNNLTWKPCTVADGGLTVWAPEDFIDSKTDSTLSKNSYLSYDSSISMNIYVSVDTLNKYRWYSSDSAFWETNNKGFVNEGDSLISSVDSYTGKIRTSELVIKRKNTQLFTRAKEYQYGTIVYTVVLRSEADVINSEKVNKLMNDVHFNKPMIDFDVTKSRAAQLLNDLSGKDSATVNEAYDEMKNASFDSSDIAMLHECLIKKYSAPSAGEDSSAINERTARILSGLGARSTIKFASDNYNSLTGDKKYLKPNILYMLSTMRTKESYDSLFSLIKANPKDDLFPYFSYRVTDSLKLAANYGNDVLGYLKDSSRGMQMVNILNQLHDSSLIALEPISKHENEFIALAKNDLSGKDHSKRSFDLMSILSKLKTQKSLATLRGYLNIKDQRFIKEQAVVLLAKNNQPLSATVLNSLAADPQTRARLYNDLKEIKKHALFPKLYLTQKSLGESSLCDVVSSDDYDVKAIKFIAEKTATYNNKKYKFYLFKVTLDDDRGSYLGVAGGYDIAGKSAEAEEDLSSMYYEEEFDAAKINELFKAWMQGFEDDK
ncbi:TraB/GumN family protein [Chitinophagaceae bacterium 26-R-25]|nr:TraB/GumN family protein [Chitinophagaceae bacterium 26-R-25]